MWLTYGTYGLNLADKMPDASTLSQNRMRRFNESDVYQQIFDNIVGQDINKRMVSGHKIYMHSSYLKVNANKISTGRSMFRMSDKPISG